MIDETEEMRIVEGNFKDLFDRLKRINNLGVISEVFEMAKYPKYEHGLGTIHQINNLLEIADNNSIPEKYIKPLELASLFLHTGHLPFTYSSERALLLASNLGERNQENKIKKYVITRLKKLLDKSNFNDDKKQHILDNIFSLKDYKILYKCFSGEIVVNKWGNLKNKIDILNDKHLELIIEDLIDVESAGYKFLNLADKADYVQRDALYFGTVRIDISPKHLYSGISKYNPRFSVSEEKLIEANLNYLTERFYNNSDAIWFDRLYEKILASIIISKNFKLEWLEKYNDDQFKRLILYNFDYGNKKTNLPSTWTKRANELFNGKIQYKKVFSFENISFPKIKDVIDIEYELIGKKETNTGLLTYPFTEGILLSIDYSNEYKFPVHPHYNIFYITIFQDKTNKSIIKLLKVIKNLSPYLSIISHVKNIREGFGGELSYTKEVRFENEKIFNAIAETILSIERDKYKKGDFIEKYLKSISNITTFKKLWHNFENQYVWKDRTINISKKNRKNHDDLELYNLFIEGLLSLPVQLLQYESTKQYLNEIYNKLLENIHSTNSNDEKGHFFEALCLIDKMRIKKGSFQFFMNGMVAIDLEKPVNKRDRNEFDIIELLINKDGKAECWIYACSIADNYKSNNSKQMTKLADHINEAFSKLIIRTRYLTPANKNAGEYNPKEEDAGRNYN
jgi:HD superfamily phosphohydrolase